MARAGEGPSLVESLTYRWRGHSKSDRNRYRSKEEIDAWIARDPIGRYEQTLLDCGLIDAAQIEAIRASVAQEIEAVEEDPHIFFTDGGDSATFSLEGK